MTYAAIRRFAALASQHALTEDELLAALRTAREDASTITVEAVEHAVADVLAARASRAA